MYKFLFRILEVFLCVLILALISQGIHTHNAEPFCKAVIGVFALCFACLGDVLTDEE